jgi:uncharacterized GH25 family protein
MTFKRTLSIFSLTSAVMLSSSVALAHDFWMAPTAYQIDAPATVPVSVMIGHPQDHMYWPVDADRVIAFRSLDKNGVTDQQASIANYSQSSGLSVRLDGSGLHILTIETVRAFSELAAGKFEDYLDEEGLTAIKMDRVRRKMTEQPGTERYSRRGKTLLQVGPVTDADTELLRRPVGLTLEIIPMDHPLTWVDGEALDATVMFRGAPLGGASVELIDLSDDATPPSRAVTQADGTVSFDYPGAGSWMFHVVWGNRSTLSPEADYNTFFSSLSFQTQ